MGINGVGRLQSVKMTGNAEKQDAARDNIESNLAEHQKQVDESHAQALREVEKNREAREAKGLGQLLGTIFLGPIIGTLIGDAIGGWANDGDEADARDAKKKTGVADLQVQKSFDKFQESKESLQDAQKNAKEVQKISSELREAQWISTSS